MKLFLYFALIATMVSIVMSNQGIWGKREPGDELIFTKAINTPAKKKQVLEETVTYNPWFFKHNITAIIVSSLKKGAEPDVQVVKGGVGQKLVTLRLVSQRSKGIRADVGIYAKKKDK